MMGVLVPNNPAEEDMPHKKREAEARANLRTQIDENLKRVYQSSLTETLPDRFTELLAQLKSVPAADRADEGAK